MREEPLHLAGACLGVVVDLPRLPVDVQRDGRPSLDPALADPTVEEQLAPSARGEPVRLAHQTGGKGGVVALLLGPLGGIDDLVLGGRSTVWAVRTGSHETGPPKTCRNRQQPRGP